MLQTVVRMAGRTVGRIGGLMAGPIRTGLVAAALALAPPGNAFAQEASVQITAEPNYGRLVINFPSENLLPKYTISTDNGVLVVNFDNPVKIAVDRVASVLGQYVMIARADPEQRGARFALARGVRVNTMEAGAKLFIDFLPANWTGPPPRLPDDVIADLARRADEAARAAREAELMKIAGSKAAKLDLRIGRAPTFTRFTFRWNLPFEAEFNRQDTGVSVRFNRKANLDLSEIKADMPPFLDDIDTETFEEGMTVLMSVQPTADVRAFRDDGAYVVDIQGSADEVAQNAVAAAVQAAVGAAGPVPSHATEQVHAPGAQPAGGAHGAETAHSAAPSSGEGHGGAADHGGAAGHGESPAAAPAEGHAAASEGHQAPGHEDQAAGHGDQAAGHGEQAAGHGDPAADAAGHSPEAPLHAGPSIEGTPAGGHATVVSEEKPPEMADEPHGADHGSDGGHGAPDMPKAPDAAPHGSPEHADGSGERALADSVIRVEAKRIGSATRLVFPYQKEIGSALFSRGNAIWLVFDDPSPIDAAPLQDALAGYARAIRPIQIGGEAQALRIELAEPLLATLNPDGTYWIVTIGDMVMAPTRPLPIKRSVRADGFAALDIPFGPVSAMHQIVDPDSGETIDVVTGKGQPRGLVKPQSFAEVEALSSAHGIALLPKVDDLQVKSEGELVSVRRPSGLSISTDAAPKRAAVLDLSQAIGASFAKRAGFVDFADAEARDPPDFWKKRHDLMGQVAQARDKSERVDRWYKVAKFNVANALGPEAMGVLDLTGSIAPEETASDRMTMLRAGALLVMNRPKDALAMLDRPDLSDSPDAAVWRTIAFADLGRFTDARKQIPRAEQVINSFPFSVQKRFMLASVATALELNDYAKARALLAEIDPKRLSKEEMDRLDLLNARAMDAEGHAGDAVGVLSKIVRTGRGPVAAEATYRLVRLQRREGLITLDQALDRLEQLAVSWRGDDIELKTLRTLGQYSIEKGNYRRAFEVMRTATQIAPEAPTTRLMQDEMGAAFASLYLDGKADEMKPIDALTLYYDFRELTPLGARGDAMVRKLADRLVDVDLLPQAQELLSYQIENRLRGAARAQVAADLALIYILDQRPERALLTLSRTRQSELPAGIERQRRTVEARALAATGKPDLALDLLTPLRGGDIERLRADILWENERWQDAGDQYERMLGGRWNDVLPLSDQEQMQVLKAGIAFSIAGDRLSLDRLRTKYARKMGESPNGAAFEAVTGPVLAKGDSFNEVVKSIAAVGTMDAFLADYRKRYLDLGGGDKPVVQGADGKPLDPGTAPGDGPQPDAAAPIPSADAATPGAPKAG